MNGSVSHYITYLIFDVLDIDLLKNRKTNRIKESVHLRVKEFHIPNIHVAKIQNDEKTNDLLKLASIWI